MDQEGALISLNQLLSKALQSETLQTDRHRADKVTDLISKTKSIVSQEWPVQNAGKRIFLGLYAVKEIEELDDDIARDMERIDYAIKNPSK